MFRTTLPVLLAALLGGAAQAARAEIAPTFIEPDAKTGASLAVVVGEGPLLHTGQLLPFDSAEEAAGQAPAAQFERLLDRLAAALKEAESGLSRVVKLNVYLARQELLPELHRALARRFAGPEKPALCVVATPLKVPGVLVALDAVATTSLDPGRGVRQLPHGAVVPVGTRIYVAGQAERADSLDEATRKTLESLRATLRHLGRRDEDIAQLKAFLTPMASAAEVQRTVTEFFGDRPAPPLVLVEWKSSPTTPIEIELVAWGGMNNPGEPVEYVTPPGMTASPVYSRVALVNHARTIYVSGLYAALQSGADPHAPESGEREVVEVFSALEGVLRGAGSDLSHLAKATYYVSTEAASKKLNDLRPKYYNPQRPPSASKAAVAGVGHAGLGLTLDMIAVPSVTPEKPEYGPAEYGHGLSEAEALAGWISLFDGQTTFGWRGAKVAEGLLSGGETTTLFGNCELSATFARGGKLLIGGREQTASEGDFHLGETAPDSKAAYPVRLGEGVRISKLAVRPLALESLFNGKDLSGWKVIDHPRVSEEQRPVWKVEAGAIRAIGGPGCLEYQGARFGNLVLQLDVRTRARHTNGGVFVRAIPGDFLNGYEAQIFNRATDGDPARPAVWSSGAIDDRQNARRLVSRDRQPYRMTIVAHDNHLATWVNGYQQTDFADSRPPHENARIGLRTKPGAIQLQAHDRGANLEFNNLGAREWTSTRETE